MPYRLRGITVLLVMLLSLGMLTGCGDNAYKVNIKYHTKEQLIEKIAGAQDRSIAVLDFDLSKIDSVMGYGRHRQFIVIPERGPDAVLDKNKLRKTLTDGIAFQLEGAGFKVSKFEKRDQIKNDYDAIITGSIVKYTVDWQQNIAFFHTEWSEISGDARVFNQRTRKIVFQTELHEENKHSRAAWGNEFPVSPSYVLTQMIDGLCTNPQFIDALEDIAAPPVGGRRNARDR